MAEGGKNPTGTHARKVMKSCKVCENGFKHRQQGMKKCKHIQHPNQAWNDKVGQVQVGKEHRWW